MEVILHKKPKCDILIEGFPGFGLIGPIVTEYLLEHLNCECIGEIRYDELPATVAIHKGDLVRPISIHHNKKHNIIIVHSILDVKGFEWKIAQAISELVQQLELKEIISLEGVASDGGEELFCFKNDGFEKLGAKPVNESVIMGVTASLLLSEPNVGCLFAETHSNMPDSRAAAKIIEFLDKYIKLEVDVKPLKMQAELFEKKVAGLMKNAKKTTSEAERKQMSYLG